MIGAIIGDIIGSRFEFNNHKSKEFELFHEVCRVTDDSIMTLAVAKAIMETEKVIQSSAAGVEHGEYTSLLKSKSITWMQKLGRKYPDCGFGGMFSRWIFSDAPEPYNSFGNGAAMRVSPVGFFASTEQQARRLSGIITETSHNHDEGIKGAEAAAMAMFMAKEGCTKGEIRDRISRDYYPLDFTIDEIRDSYLFDVTCQGTVPQAILAFLESESFEDAIRTAISIGGDSDTLAAITGAIAEAYYGVPETLRQKALTYLDKELRAIYDEWCDFYKNKCTSGKYEVLTKYIAKIRELDSFGEWVVDDKKDDKSEGPYHMPFFDYNELVHSFVQEFYQFSRSHPEYELTDYSSILESNALKWDGTSMSHADVASLDDQCILALIMGAIRADRFCEGTLLGFLKNGLLEKWLTRLKSIDDNDNRADSSSE